MKTCACCETEKPLEDFNRNKSLPSGYTSSCKVCRAEQRRTLYAAKKENPPPRPLSKVYSNCSQEKGSSEFVAALDYLDGLHPVCKKCRQTLAKEKYDTDIARVKTLKDRFGLSLEDYTEILRLQGGRCAICNSDNPRRQGTLNFLVDHDHETGKVRGLLCHPCNSGLGMFGDNLEGVEAAAAYLRKNNG